MLSFLFQSRELPEQETRGTTDKQGKTEAKKKIRVFCVDEHKFSLSHIVGYVKTAMPEATVLGMDCPEEAETLAAQEGCDVLFTEIEFGGLPLGIDLARRIQDRNPRVNIIFVTVCSRKEYADEVMALRPSGYLTKVVTEQDVREALAQLLYEVA